MKAWLCTIAAILVSAHAMGDERVDTCVDAADHAQQERDAGKLKAARVQLLTCSAEGCPGPVAKQCAKWLREVDDEMPSISLRVRDANGADVIDVSVIADDQPLLVGLDGRSVPLDPGVHKFVFRRPGSAEAEQSFVVRSGEKNRIVDVQLQSSEAPISKPTIVVAPAPPRVSHFRFPWAAGVSIGVGVVGFAAMGVLIGVAGGDLNQLRTTCAPQCDPSDVDAVHTKLVVADVALGVGIAGVAVAAIALIVANTGHSDSKRATALVGRGLTW